MIKRRIKEQRSSEKGGDPDSKLIGSSNSREVDPQEGLEGVEWDVDSSRDSLGIRHANPRKAQGTKKVLSKSSNWDPKSSDKDR